LQWLLLLFFTLVTICSSELTFYEQQISWTTETVIVLLTKGIIQSSMEAKKLSLRVEVHSLDVEG
jgi:hypothetical protein